MVLQIVFHAEFSHLPERLGHFADYNSIPQNRTTTFDPVLTVAILLKYLKCGDYMKNLHTLSQIPSSCLYTQLMVCATAPRIPKNFSPSHVKILFCTDKIESIEYQDLVPRQRTGDCLLIHIGRCDPPSSSHQTFLHEVEFRQWVFCKDPVLFWFSSIRRNFGLLECEYKYSFRIWFPRTVCGCRHFCDFQIFYEIL